MRDRILEIISEQIDIPVEKINSNDTLGDLNVDSLDTTEIIMSIEDEYNINIPDGTGITNNSTIKEVLDLVEKFIEEK